MELKFLIFIVLCSKPFSGSAHEITHTLTQAGSELWGEIGGEKQEDGSNIVTIGLDEEHGPRRYEEVKVFHLGGGRGRGNGGHGGGQINSRPSKTYAKSDASTLLARPSLVISAGLLQVIIIALLIVFIHISL